MSRFFIKQISVTGEKVLFSEVSFNDGVNIIYGPSNAGKSYIINCINFMFAGDPPFTKSSTGYDTVTMTMESDDGYAISMTRKIIDGKNGEVGENSVEVISNYPNVESGPYSISKNEYSDLLLKLMGINEHHKIISTEGFDSQSLGIRTLIHFFFIDEEHIFERFYQGSKKEGSTGLGLAIADSICRLQHLNIRYYFEQEEHCFEILK